MDTATLDYLRTITKRLDSAKHGEKSAIVELAAAYLCCSNKQV